MKNPENIELKSFVGKHVLSAVFFDTIGDAQVLRFTLDGNYYEAVQDQHDGYRSYLERVSKSRKRPKKQIEPVAVVGRMHPNNGSEDVLQFLNPKTKKPILEFGTSGIDDYYPGFVAEFHPENI